ncbi:hypothetical protein BD779DRAFT_1512952 [Infundibulicybe gibba]|nr:hypothetical protein BD779DRAFT_1512952 [Infundibulicybe gibba]
MSAYQAGTATSRARTSVVMQPDNAQLRELLAAMSSTLGGLGRSFETLGEQSTKLTTLGPRVEDISRELQELQRKLQEHDRTQRESIREMKKNMRGTISKELFQTFNRPLIKARVASEIKAQAKEQVDIQIRNYIPVSLRQQVLDNERHLKEANVSILNSESRIQNAALDLDNQDEPLAPILKTDGSRSKLFPADLRSLFAYELEMAQQLLKDYGIEEAGILEVNFNRFMSHAGVKFQLVVVP